MFERTHYSNGRKTFEFSGEKLTWFFKTGIIKAEGLFISGQMDGEWKFYRESGQLWQIGHFRNGIKDGSWIRYDKSGNLEYNETYMNGKVVKR
jgi:antitoxin component YwqK of YwqJK toxin-antitoxin module